MKRPAGTMIPLTDLRHLVPPYTITIRVVSALRLRGRVFTEWALDRV